MPDERELAAGRFLGDNQRNYLAGKYEPPDKNAERQYRSQIRDRTVGGILDLGLVAQNLERPDRELLFNYATERGEIVDEVKDVQLFPEYRHGKWGDIGFVREFGEIFLFFWKTYRENDATRDTLLRHLEQWTQKAEHEYRHGFERFEGWEEQGKLPTDVESNFDMRTLDDVDIDALLDRLDPGAEGGRAAVSELSGLEMKALVESGEADLQLTR